MQSLVLRCHSIRRKTHKLVDGFYEILGRVRDGDVGGTGVEVSVSSPVVDQGRICAQWVMFTDCGWSFEASLLWHWWWGKKKNIIKIPVSTVYRVLFF